MSCPSFLFVDDSDKESGFLSGQDIIFVGQVVNVTADLQCENFSEGSLCLTLSLTSSRGVW